MKTTIILLALLCSLTLAAKDKGKCKMKYLTSLQKGLHSYWAFNETSPGGLANLGGTRYDSTGRHDLASIGDVPYKRGPDWAIRGPGAFFSPAAGAVLQKTAMQSLDGHDVTLAFWLLVAAAPADGDHSVIISHSLPGFSISVINDGGTLRMQFSRWYAPYPGVEYVTTSDDEVPLHFWTHIRCWSDFENDLLAVSINNAKATKVITQNEPIGVAGGDFIIGGRSDFSHFLNGGIDELGWWLRPLTDTEGDFLTKRFPGHPGQYPSYEDFFAPSCPSIECCK